MKSLSLLPLLVVTTLCTTTASAWDAPSTETPLREIPYGVTFEYNYSVLLNGITGDTPRFKSAVFKDESRACQIFARPERPELTHYQSHNSRYYAGSLDYYKVMVVTDRMVLLSREIVENTLGKDTATIRLDFAHNEPYNGKKWFLNLTCDLKNGADITVGQLSALSREMFWILLSPNRRD